MNFKNEEHLIKGKGLICFISAFSKVLFTCFYSTRTDVPYVSRLFPRHVPRGTKVVYHKVIRLVEVAVVLQLGGVYYHRHV